LPSEQKAIGNVNNTTHNSQIGAEKGLLEKFQRQTISEITGINSWTKHGKEK